MTKDDTPEGTTEQHAADLAATKWWLVCEDCDVGLLGIAARNPSTTLNSPAVVSVVGRSASRRAIITDRKRLIVFWELP